MDRDPNICKTLRMELKDLKRHFSKEAQTFADICGSILDHAVPTCPGWTVQDLIEHLGTVHRRAISRIGTDTDPGSYEIDVPSDSSEILGWYEKGWRELASIFQTTSAESPAWNWTGKNQTLGWTIRRQSHETAIHRYDAELAKMGLPNVNAFKSLPSESLPFGFEPEFAVDGLNERLEVSIGGKPHLKGTLPGTIHLHATDVDAEWTVSLKDGIIGISREHQKADAAIRATASELYLWSWGRLPVEILEHFGDSEVIEAWKKLPS